MTVSIQKTNRKYWITLPIILICLVAWTPMLTCRGEYLPGIEWPEPVIVTPAEKISLPPSDAIVLFDGTDMSEWELVDGQQMDKQTDKRRWRLDKGAMIVGKGNIHTKQSFGDCQLHIEWSSPSEAKGNGQQRGNSGVFFHEMYEIQILDSYQNKTYFEGQTGAIYKQTPPMVNAMRPPGEWNTYDIIWTSPRFNDDGSLKSPAAITAFHNGVLVQNHFELLGPTPYMQAPKYKAHPIEGKILLQDHGNPVRYRNIWVRKIKPLVGKRIAEPSYLNHATGKRWLASEADGDGNPLE